MKKFRVKKSSVIVMGLVAVSLWVAASYGQPLGGMGGRGMMGRGPGRLLHLVLRGVGLTDDQKTQVKAIMAAHRPTFQALFRQLRAANEEIGNKLLAPGEVNPTDLTSASQQAAQIREQLSQEGIKVMLEVRALLTPDQLAKAAQLRDQLRALRAEMQDLLGAQP